MSLTNITSTQEMPIQAVLAPTDLKPGVLVLLDPDRHPSTFDAITAIDANVEHIMPYGGVTVADVQRLVHGCIFTRGARALNRTAIFVGGSNVAEADAIAFEVRRHLLPQHKLSVSVMVDPSGANTTAAAAVRCATRIIHELRGCKALVLGGTGPVGQRVARLLAKQGAHVRVASRDKDRAVAVAEGLKMLVPNAKVEGVSAGSSADAPAALADRELVIAAGAPGAVLLPKRARDGASKLKVLIDLNGVPPAGIEGVDTKDTGAMKDGGVFAFGALGVGGLKMKIHRAAIQALYTSNTLFLDTDEIYQLALKEQ